MRRRFTLIQGGRGDGVPETGPRVRLRRADAVEAAEIAAWRGLAADAQQPDPFADPDFLLTAARHAPCRDGDLVLAFVSAAGTDGGGLLGVLPLVLPRPLRGGPIRLWQPALAPRPVEPALAPGRAVEAVAAVEAHLRAVRPRSTLCLAALGPGAARRALRAEGGIERGRAPVATAIPAGQFVPLAAGLPPERTERASAPEAVRAAVERFLLAEARHARAPLLADPGAAAAIRVATRLLARRGLAEVELGLAGDAVVSGTIRLGPPGRREAWCTVAPGDGRSRPERPSNDDPGPPSLGGRPGGPRLRLVIG